MDDVFQCEITILYDLMSNVQTQASEGSRVRDQGPQRGQPTRSSKTQEQPLPCQVTRSPEVARGTRPPAASHILGGALRSCGHSYRVLMCDSTSSKVYRGSRDGEQQAASAQSAGM